MKRIGYVNEGLTDEGKRRLEEAARLGLCPYHWTPLPPKNLVWCGKGEPIGPTDNPATAAVWSCYWAFHQDPRWGRIKDWKMIRERALARDGKRCVNCGAGATEVDHIVEIQDGGPEFDPANLRSLCHACHVTKTAARRRWKSSRMAEWALRDRVLQLNLRVEDST